jgi:hypothetical protein
VRIGNNCTSIERKTETLLVQCTSTCAVSLGRHDWLRAFYFDFLHCAVDPRKAENLSAGKNTLWANIGANQFHLPQGNPNAQVLDGIITLAYSNLQPLISRYDNKDIQTKLDGSKFSLKKQSDNELLVTDPWGTQFRIVPGFEEERDARGVQPGDASEGLALRDLTLYTPSAINCNMAGIARFYETVLGAPILEQDANRVVVSVGLHQTLTFCLPPNGVTVNHADLREDATFQPPSGCPKYLCNYGPHVSMYVADLPACYNKANDLGIVYVNPRFARHAYTLDQAVDDCMFRCLDIVDPDNPGAGPIMRLEHEIRSVVRRDGSKYESCPFYNLPEQCKQ